MDEREKFEERLKVTWAGRDAGPGFLRLTPEFRCRRKGWVKTLGYGE